MYLGIAGGAIPVLVRLVEFKFTYVLIYVFFFFTLITGTVILLKS